MGPVLSSQPLSAEGFSPPQVISRAYGSPQVALMVKNLPANAGDRHKSLGFDPWVWKIPWRREWQRHSSILAWRSQWTEEPGGLQSIGLQSRTQLKQLSTHTAPRQ